MGIMFYEASAFNQYVGNWDTASVMVLTGAFEEASAFNQYLFGVH